MRRTRGRRDGDFGPWRGFDYAIHAMHIMKFRRSSRRPLGPLDAKVSSRAVRRRQPPLLNATPGGDTGAPETSNNPIPRELYHTDWLADLAVDWLKKLDGERRLVSVAQLSRSASSLGSAACRNLGAATGATCRCPRAIPASPEKIREVLAQEARALARLLRRHLRRIWKAGR